MRSLLVSLFLSLPLMAQESAPPPAPPAQEEKAESDIAYEQEVKLDEKIRKEGDLPPESQQRQAKQDCQCPEPQEQQAAPSLFPEQSVFFISPAPAPTPQQQQRQEEPSAPQSPPGFNDSQFGRNQFQGPSNFPPSTGREWPVWP